MIREALAWIVGVIVAIFVIMLIGVYGFGWFSNATANFRGGVQARNQINGNGTYRIAAYDNFFDLCAGVQSREAAIRNAQDEAKTAAPARKEQLAAVITANRNERADLINQYNADAGKSGTRGQFRASNLPYRLSLDTQETQCTA